MKFMIELAENLILRMMEDRKEREHVYEIEERCKKTKGMWSLHIRPYGFWSFDRFNAQLVWDSQISQTPLRHDPYDDILADRDPTAKP